ncbi:MAG: rhodanese-like domain-containing protein [Deltaproteobacteria bacterium]|nr:rhodanese-like domain-containing protein [Deltaproteobacteria bacterium]
MKHAPTPWIAAAMSVLALSAACSRKSDAATPTSGTAAEQAMPELTVDALSAMIERHETVAIFDANGRERYEEGHIPGARHVGHDRLTAQNLPADHSTPLVFYCYNER